VGRNSRLDALARRLTFKQQTDLIIERKRTYHPIKLLVEAVAYQAAQVEALRSAGVYAVPVKTTKDKVTRFLRLAARFEAGTVFLRRGMHDDLVEQLLLAPEGQHDDLLDALEMAVSAEAGIYGDTLCWTDINLAYFRPDKSSRPRAYDIMHSHERWLATRPDDIYDEPR
jgi:predicted phage terminase large subunit-like protein